MIIPNYNMMYTGLQYDELLNERQNQWNYRQKIVILKKSQGTPNFQTYRKLKHKATLSLYFLFVFE